MDVANRAGTTPAVNRFRTGDRLIDLAARELLRDGEPVRVEAKVLDLIILLVEHRDRALSKREIGDRLWPSRAVTDAALSQLLRKARRALGDDGETQSMIRTVHGRGLQWVAPLISEDAADIQRPVDAADAAGVDRQRLPRKGRVALAVVLSILLIATLVAVWWSRQPDAGHQHIRIAVLATDDRTDEAEMAWSRHGVMALLSSLMADAFQLDTETVPQFDAADVDPGATEADRVRAAGETIGATHVLVSELRRLGPLYQLELRLITLASGGVHREVLSGGAPAELAADGATRVQRRLRPADPPRRAGLAVEIADPFLAEVYARGIDAELRGDHAAAARYFEICLDHDAQLLWPRLQLALAQSGSAAFDTARSNATRVADAAQTGGATDVFVHAQRLLGSIAFRQGDLDTARMHLDAAMAALPQDGSPAQRVDLLIARAAIGNEGGQLAQADKHLDVALMLAQRLGDRRREARVLLNRAVVENAGGDAEAAIASLRRGLDAARSAGDGQLEGTALLNLGGAESNAGRPALALPLLQQAVNEGRERSDRALEVHGLILLSRIVAMFGDGDAARGHARSVIDAGLSDGNPLWLAEGHAAMATVESTDKQWRKALDHLDQSLARYREGGMVRGEAQVLAQIARVAARTGDDDRTALAVSKYRALVRDGNESLADQVPLLEATLRYASGERAEAIQAVQTLLDRQGDDRGPVTQAALAEMAQWQLATGGPATALQHPAWTSWWREQPDALALRIDLLRLAGRMADAEAEQVRLASMERDARTIIESDRLRLR